MGGGGGRLATILQRGERLGKGLLPEALRQLTEEERQRCGFLPPLGEELPVHDRLRRRQHHVRHHHGPHGAKHGGPPGHRHPPDTSLGSEQGNAHCKSPAVRKPCIRPHVRRRASFLAARRRPVLGTQRHHQGGAFHEILPDAEASRQGPTRRRHTESRFRGIGTHAPCRLRGMAGL